MNTLAKENVFRAFKLHAYRIGVVALVTMMPAWLAATALFQSIQSPHALKGMGNVQLEVHVNDNGSKRFQKRGFIKALKGTVKKHLGKAGVKFKGSYDRVFVDVYVMPLESGFGEKVGHTLFIEMEVSRGGYFRAAEKKKTLLPAETVVWQSSDMASSGKSEKATRDIILKVLDRRSKSLAKTWKKAQRLK